MSFSAVPNNRLIPPSNKAELLLEEYSIQPHQHLPSFYELISIVHVQDNIHDTLRSCYDMVLAHVERWAAHRTTAPGASRTGRRNYYYYLCHHYFNRFLQLLARVLRDYRNEGYFLLSYGMELASLKSSANATMSEAFYGLTRAVLGPQNKIRALQNKDKVRLALFIATLRYLRNIRNRLPPSIQKILLVLPYISMLCQWRFLMSKSLQFDIDAYLLGQVVRRKTAQDYAKQPDKTVSSASSSHIPNRLANRSVLAGAVGAVALGWISRFVQIYQQERANRHQKSSSGALQPLSETDAARPWKQTPHLLQLEKDIQLYEPYSN